MFDAAFIADPHPTYRQLREAGPLHWTPEWRSGGWLVPRYVDVAAALRDPRLSSQRNLTAAYPAEVQQELSALTRTCAQFMLFLDPPEHSRLRRLLNHAFAPQAIQQLRPRIKHIVDALLTKAVARGTLEFMADFAHPLPVLVIAELLGIPADDQLRFQDWSDDFIAFFGNPRSTVETARRAQDSLIAMAEYFRRLLPERRRQPGADLVSLLLRLEGDDGLTEEELLSQCALLLIAGHETTRNLLGNGLLALLQHPDQMALLQREPELMPAAVNELGRYISAIQLTSRSATEDFEWHGQQIKRGQAVVLLIGSANHDPGRWTQPDRLDITRHQGRPLSFGHGAHYCSGAALANLEAEIGLTAVLQHMPGLKLVDRAPAWSPNVAFRGLSRLQVATR